MDNRTIEEIRNNETKLIQEIKELENINDKLSSALNSVEQRIDKAIEFIEDENNYFFGVGENWKNVKKLKSILQDKEME